MVRITMMGVQGLKCHEQPCTPFLITVFSPCTPFLIKLFSLFTCCSQFWHFRHAPHAPSTAVSNFTIFTMHPVSLNIVTMQYFSDHGMSNMAVPDLSTFTVFPRSRHFWLTPQLSNMVDLHLADAHHTVTPSAGPNHSRW